MANPQKASLLCLTEAKAGKIDMVLDLLGWRVNTWPQK